MGEVLTLAGFAFFAGMIDAIAGGGGLVLVPALFAVLPGASPATLLGTNKLSAIAGTLVATLRYAASVPIPWRSVVPASVFAGVAACAGAWAVTKVPPDLLRPLVLVLLVLVAGYTLMNRRLGVERVPLRAGARLGLRTAALGGSVGFYDGFFGPGAGSFLMFGLVRWLRRSFLEAAASARVMNLATNAGALGFFVASGHVNYAVGIPMAICSVAGGFVGASLAVRRGIPLIRGVFLAVVLVLIAKVGLDLITAG
ncbi:MAG TPA: TSUP family transporter [Burkholderiales bacterium]|nr:TSUP family transporter [Burkholderiales bacterium]